MRKNALLVICGPTATGKTSLGIKLARKFNGEIISADSRQVYRGMDIGTGKELPVNSKFEIRNSKQYQNSNIKIQNYNVGYYVINGIKVWLYDVIIPNQRFSAGEYARRAWMVIKDVWQRGKLPILVGGTGFYIKAVVDGFATMGVPADWKLREKLERYKVGELQKKLKRIDPERWETMNESDRKNKRRLVRAIEISKSQKSKVKSQSYNLKLKTKDVLFIGLTTPREVLYERIDRNVERRVKNGIIDEINGLLKQGYKWSDPGFNTLGYKEWRQFFNNEITVDEILPKWKRDEHDYARRQLTWFKKDKRIYWFDITKPVYYQRVVKLTREWYNTFKDDDKN